MHATTITAVTATIPFYATYLAASESRLSKDLVTVLYFCAVGLLLSLAAILDDSFGLTTWFGLSAGPADAWLL